MNKWIKCFFLWLLVAASGSCPQVVYAQPPVGSSLPTRPADSLRPAGADSLGRFRLVLPDSLSYRFMGEGNFSRGNVNRSLMSLRAEILLQGPVMELVSNPRFTYGEQNNLLAERDLYADLFVDVLKKKKLYGFGLAIIERSNLRRIDWRQLAGAGVGIHLLRNSRHTLSLTNAIIHEFTNFRERPSLSIQRNSTRLKGRHVFYADKVRLHHVTFLQPALSDLSNLRWSTLISLELPLTRWLALRASFENSYEQVVELTRQRYDTRVTFGFAVGNRPL